MDLPAGRTATALVVDDEPDVRAVLRKAFEDEGIAVVEAADRAQAMHSLDANVIDIVTLDLALGHEDGLLLARDIRAKRNAPIIMVTARDRPVDRVTGLEYGADDYVSKPFHLREVVLRVRNLLARYAWPPSGRDALPAAAHGQRRYLFDHLALDPVKRELCTIGGQHIELTDAEYRLMALFVENSARVLSRDEISRCLNGHDWSPFDRTIDGHVARLRRKVEASSEEPRMIKSVRGVGYVFATDVTVA